MTKREIKALVASGKSWMTFAKQSYSDSGRIKFLEKALADFTAAGDTANITLVQDTIRRFKGM